MVSPFDWQESIEHRAQFVESRLSAGVPVVAVSLDEGILLVTLRAQTRKLFEVYDQLAFAAVGLQSDVEALRVAAIDFAHQEGYQRSASDVTVQRVVTALSNPVKRAFGDLRTAPVVARCLFAELGKSREQDRYFVLDYDGDFSLQRQLASVAGTADATNALRERLAGQDWGKVKLKKAQSLLEDAVRAVWTSGEASGTGDRRVEAALLRRSDERQSRFQLLTESD